MGACSRLLVCALSLLLFWKGRSPWQELPLVPLMLYPWLALAGLPRRYLRGALSALLLDLALLLPLLAVAWRLEIQPTAARQAWPALLYWVCLHLAASFAGRAQRQIYAWTWWIFVVLLPLADAVANWGVSAGSRRTLLWPELSPLAWLHAVCSGRELGALSALAPLATCIALLGLALATGLPRRAAV